MRSKRKLTLNMKMKSKKLNRNKVYHQEEGRQQDIILVRGTLEGHSQGIEVEDYDNTSNLALSPSFYLFHVV